MQDNDLQYWGLATPSARTQAEPYLCAKQVLIGEAGDDPAQAEDPAPAEVLDHVAHGHLEERDRGNLRGVAGGRGSGSRTTVMRLQSKLGLVHRGRSRPKFSSMAWWGEGNSYGEAKTQTARARRAARCG